MRSTGVGASRLRVKFSWGRTEKRMRRAASSMELPQKMASMAVPSMPKKGLSKSKATSLLCHSDEEIYLSGYLRQHRKRLLERLLLLVRARLRIGERKKQKQKRSPNQQLASPHLISQLRLSEVLWATSKTLTRRVSFCASSWSTVSIARLTSSNASSRSSTIFLSPSASKSIIPWMLSPLRSTKPSSLRWLRATVRQVPFSSTLTNRS